LKNWFIKILGGSTASDLEKQASVLNQLITAKDVEIASLRERIKELSDEGTLFREKLFEVSGINQVQGEVRLEDKNVQPIKTGGESWTSRRQRLERMDAQRSKAKQQVDATEKHWRARNERVENA